MSHTHLWTWNGPSKSDDQVQFHVAFGIIQKSITQAPKSFKSCLKYVCPLSTILTRHRSSHKLPHWDCERFLQNNFFFWVKEILAIFVIPMIRRKLTTTILAIWVGTKWRWVSFYHADTKEKSLVTIIVPFWLWNGYGEFLIHLLCHLLSWKGVFIQLSRSALGSLFTTNLCESNTLGSGAHCPHKCGRKGIRSTTWRYSKNKE